MAATSLWHIEGCLKDLIDYVENPEKTTPNEALQDFSDVFSCVRNPEKTNDGEYVTAINCLKETALQHEISQKEKRACGSLLMTGELFLHPSLRGLNMPWPPW